MTNAKPKMRVTAKAGITVSFRRRVELFMSHPFGQRVATPSCSEGATLTTKTTQVNPFLRNLTHCAVGPKGHSRNHKASPKFPPRSRGGRRRESAAGWGHSTTNRLLCWHGQDSTDYRHHGPGRLTCRRAPATAV